MTIDTDLISNDEITQRIRSDAVLKKAVEQGYVIPDTIEEIERVCNEADNNWQHNLAKYKVGRRQLYKSATEFYNQALWVVLLFANPRMAISRRVFARYVQAIVPDVDDEQRVKDDQQVRHLSPPQDGWYVLNTNEVIPAGLQIRMPNGSLIRGDGKMKLKIGYHVLVSTDTPHPNHKVKPIVTDPNAKLTDEAWAEMKNFYSQFGHECCSVCGRHDDRLQKGHLHPKLGITVSNIVPMCQSCNMFAKKGWLFKMEPDGKVRPYGIYDESLALKIFENTDDGVLITLTRYLYARFSKFIGK
jgi:hypothetical protein